MEVVSDSNNVSQVYEDEARHKAARVQFKNEEMTGEHRFIE